MAPEDDRERDLDRARLRRQPPGTRARPEHGAAREVLHLALAVDRRVGDHGHRLLEVVRQVLALRREAGQRPVVAQRADRLLARGRHLLHELHVLALPAEAAQHAVLHLHRLGRAGRGVARDLRSLERSADGDHLRVAVHRLLARAGHPALPGQPLQLDVLAQLRLALLAVEADHHLLAGGERLGLRHRLLDGHHARLGGERVGTGGLDQPERSQAQRVHREDALVAVTSQQRHRSLRERAEGLAQVHVERAQLFGELLDLVHDRRQHQLERLHERQRAAVHERLHRAVEVLRVGAVRVDRHVQHARLLAQLRDRVDLAVVAEHRERLNALEGGPGVRGVAVVADHRRRLGPLVQQVRVVLAEHGRARPSPCRRRSRWRTRPRGRPAPARAPRPARSTVAPRRSGRRPARRSAPPRGPWARARTSPPRPRARPARAARSGS